MPDHHIWCEGTKKPASGAGRVMGKAKTSPKVHQMQCLANHMVAIS